MILVVDDELEVRRAVRRVLESVGFEVETCSGGIEAFRRLEACEAAGQPAELVLTDLRMDNGDGLSLIRQIRYRWPPLSVVVMSAFADRSTLREILGLACEGFVDKPFRPTEIVDVVAGALARTQGPGEHATRPWDSDGSARARACPYVFGRYEVLSLIARGATGSVYRARQMDLDRPVALKFVHARAEVGPFRREARAMARLDHPNVPVIYEVGRLEGVDFIAMELIVGPTLGTVLRQRGKLGELEAVELLLPIAEALREAHALGILHRDIKPDNILVARTGRPILVDFGIALWQEESDDNRDLQGTVPYMAPEYILGDPYDSACDCYSLGLVLYECLVGRPGCRCQGERIDFEGLTRLAHETPEATRTAAPETDRALARIVDSAIAPHETRLSLQRLILSLRRWLVGRARNRGLEASERVHA